MVYCLFYSVIFMVCKPLQMEILESLYNPGCLLTDVLFCLHFLIAVLFWGAFTWCHLLLVSFPWFPCLGCNLSQTSEIISDLSMYNKRYHYFRCSFLLFQPNNLHLDLLSPCANSAYDASLLCLFYFALFSGTKSSYAYFNVIYASINQHYRLQEAVRIGGDFIIKIPPHCH